MKILIADDNAFYRRMLAATLMEWGYEVVPVSDGQAAWEVLSRSDAPKLALLDWVMPGLEGPEICRRVRAMHKPEPTYILLLTSQAGKENLLAGLEAGADDYVNKPFDRDELRARLGVGLRIVGLQTSQTMVFALARAVEAKSPYTQGHSDRVTHYALALADHVNVPAREREVLRRGASLHDIGKISTPDAILDKPGRLTPEEFEVIKRHPAVGVSIIEPLESLRDTIPLIRWHHERLDGRGYPDGLRGDDIPYLVRILSVADVYDALSSKRPYRDGMSHEDCLKELRSSAAGGGLDAGLVESFATLPSSVFPAAEGGAVTAPAVGADGRAPCPSRTLMKVAR